MKDLDLRIFAPWRVTVPGFKSSPDAGIFQMPSALDGRSLRIIATATDGWDHVSVSRVDRCPAWEELEQVKRLFFWPAETAMQLHVPPAEHINNSPYCLHLWRPQIGEIPRPPGWMVGIADKGPREIEALGMGVFHHG